MFWKRYRNRNVIIGIIYNVSVFIFISKMVSMIYRYE
jgi:hypothetical protein